MSDKKMLKLCTYLIIVRMFQSALGVQDLGQFYYKPVKDGNGSIVLVTINQVRESKAVQSTHVKWMPLPKIQKRIACAFEGLAAPELLLASTSVSLTFTFI